MRTVLQDLRYGGRLLTRNPGFTAIAVMALALGIGANTAIFSVVNAVLLSPLPYSDPGRIAFIWTNNPSMQAGYTELPPTDSEINGYLKKSQVLSAVAAFASRPLNISGDAEPERVGGVQATAGLIPLLGIRPFRGRAFTADEDQPGKNRVAVISYGLWQRRFGGDPFLVGKNIVLDAIDFTVVGIMPPGFQFPQGNEMPPAYRFAQQPDIWVPLAFSSARWQSHDERSLVTIVRLQAGITLARAQAEISAASRRAGEESPATNAGWEARLVPVEEQIAGKARPALMVLLAAVGCVLLIACANVANLLLARATSRRREIAIRSSMGAGRWRVLRQLLTESILLSVSGGAAGLLLAGWGIKLLIAAGSVHVPRLAETHLDIRVLGFALVVSLLTGIVFGLAPAVEISRTSVNEVLKAASTRTSAPAARYFVVSEMALALVLLAAAGLMVRSFWRLQAVDPGFRPRSVLALDMSLRGAKYSQEEQQSAFLEQAMARIETVPGVRGAGAISALPLGGAEELNYLVIEGRPPAPPGGEIMANERTITPGYFGALGVPLAEGRFFDSRDVKGQPRVVIVNETLAHRFFPHESPLGKRVKFGWIWDKSPWRTIVGVVHDTKTASLEAAPRVAVYRPYPQNPMKEMTVVVRAESDPQALAGAVRRAIQAVDPIQAVSNVRSMEQVVSESMARRRFQMLLLGLFAALALALTVIGLYGVIAYSVSRRTQEIGIRMALGARQADVLHMIVKEGMALAAAGVAIGLLLALAAAHALAGFLYGVSSRDPATFLGVSVLVGAVSLAASLIPARRAAKVDPMVALRYE